MSKRTNSRTATLMEAARAMCGACRDGVPVTQRDGQVIHTAIDMHRVLRVSYGMSCNASPIYGLINPAKKARKSR